MSDWLGEEFRRADAVLDSLPAGALPLVTGRRAKDWKAYIVVGERHTERVLWTDYETGITVDMRAVYPPNVAASLINEEIRQTFLDLEEKIRIERDAHADEVRRQRRTRVCMIPDCGCNGLEHP